MFKKIKIVGDEIFYDRVLVAKIFEGCKEQTILGKFKEQIVKEPVNNVYTCDWCGETEEEDDD